MQRVRDAAYDPPRRPPHETPIEISDTCAGMAGSYRADHAWSLGASRGGMIAFCVPTEALGAYVEACDYWRHDTDRLIIPSGIGIVPEVSGRARPRLAARKPTLLPFPISHVVLRFLHQSPRSPSRTAVVDAILF